MAACHRKLHSKYTIQKECVRIENGQQKCKVDRFCKRAKTGKHIDTVPQTTQENKVFF